MVFIDVQNQTIGQRMNRQQNFYWRYRDIKQNSIKLIDIAAAIILLSQNMKLDLISKFI